MELIRSEDTKARIKASMAETHARRKSQICRVFELKVSIRHNPKETFQKLAQCFKEAKWVINDMLSLSKDNPDNMPYANADRCGAYDTSNYNTLDEGDWIIRHTGYDNSFSNADPNRLVPVDAMRTLEKEGFIGKLHNVYLATTGLIATVENSTKTAKQMVDYVRNHNIDAVILTST